MHSGAFCLRLLTRGCLGKSISLIATQFVERLCFDGRGKNCFLPQSVYQAHANCDVVGSKNFRSPRRISSSCKGRMGRDIYHAIQVHSLIATFTILDFVVRKRQFANATCVIRITHVLSHCVWLDNHFQYGRRPRSNIAAITSTPENHSGAINCN